MKVLQKGWATAAALLAGGLFAVPTTPALASNASGADQPGAAHITDDAGLFSAGAKKQVENKMAAAKFHRGLHFSVDTHKTMPAEWKSKLDAASDHAAKSAVVQEWARSIAKSDREFGPFVLICKRPGWTAVVVDRETENRGLRTSDEEAIFKIINAGMLEGGKLENAGKMPEAMKARDEALLKATDYVINDMKGTKVANTDGTPLKEDTKAAPAKKQGGGMGVGGWICLGLCVLLGIWLVIGLIRAFTGGGGGYGGGGGGYGGGGGFGTALLGGLFGAMAGMWLYNSMFGTHYPPSAFGGEATAGDSYGGGDTGDTGRGDYDGGSGTAGGGDYGGDDAGGGGDYGGGDYGGGDTGGDYGGGDAGGDYGGGGDFGGGDFGGGGDF